MNIENFLSNKEPDFKNRFLQDIWNYSDEEIEHTHDFIQLLFPLNEESSAVSNAKYLDSREVIQDIKSNKSAKENIVKSSQWFLSFLERNSHWKRRYDHNYYRISRIIKSLRLLVSDEDADMFYKSFMLLIDEQHKAKINSITLNYWENA
tara:strand:- start:59 stop:508 length:450 start_codon:yes stop_codon:yes gene_type:complete